MSQDEFEEIQRNPQAALEVLARKFSAERQYARLFETQLLRKRLELGLPLVHTGSLDEIPAEHRSAYETAFIEAAREAGRLYLDAGDIPRAWSYYRAIGEPGPVAAAIEQVSPGDDVQSVIEIAFHEGVNPTKGFELILSQFGTCRAISYFQQFPRGPGRVASLHLLVRTLYDSLTDSLKRTIEQTEGQPPAATRVSELIAGRDWLFGKFCYYVDTSHLIEVLRFSLELEDREMLGLALELAEYGDRLSEEFHYHGEPPFEDYRAYILYFGALLGRDAEEAVAHFRQQISEDNSGNNRPAQVLVGLLAKLGRYADAVEACLKYLPEDDTGLFQLCQAAGDFERLAQLARDRGDLVTFSAAVLQMPR